MVKIDKYKNMTNKLPSIVNFVKDYASDYSITTITDEAVVDMIISNAQSIFTKNVYDSFRKIIGDNSIGNLKRGNIYRLCYALNIDTLDKANNFLSNYLGENPLSPRVMEEFAIIAGYRLGLPWSEVHRIITNVKNLYKNTIVTSTSEIILGGTEDLAREIDTAVNSVTDLEDFLKANCEHGYFAITRNTQYAAFFNYIDWSKYNPKRESIEDFVKTINGAVLKSVHQRTFGFISSDDAYSDTNNPVLTAKEIKALSKVFPNAFLKYENYIKLLNRTRREQISSETLLIAIMNDSCVDKGEESLYEPGDLSYELWGSDGYLDFTDEEAFENGLNTFLANGGCALLNRNIGFDCLILDAHHDIVEKYRDEIMDGKLSNVDVKSLYYAYLRKCFREIITLPK